MGAGHPSAYPLEREPMSERYFDIKRDLEIINNDGFLCEACLIVKPLSEQSEKNTRFCESCQQFMDSWKLQDSESSPPNIAQKASERTQGQYGGVTKPT